MGIDGVGDKVKLKFAFKCGGGFLVVFVVVVGGGGGGGIWEMRGGWIWLWWWWWCFFELVLFLVLLYLLPATKRETSRVENRSDVLHSRRRRTLLYRRRRLHIIPTLHIHPNKCMIMIMIITINLNPLISRPNPPIPPFPSLIPPRHHHPSIQPRLGHIPPGTGLQHFRLTIPHPTTTQFRIKIPFRKITLTNHNPIDISAIICDILNFPPDFFFLS